MFVFCNQIAMEDIVMSICYDKLWNLMKENKMNKKRLAAAAEISPYMMSKLKNKQPVAMEAMINLCQVFHCDIGDIMEVIEDEQDGR